MATDPMQLDLRSQVAEAARSVGLGGSYDLIHAGTNDVFRSEEAKCVARDRYQLWPVAG